MNFDQLKQRFSGAIQSAPEDVHLKRENHWHQHPRGLGWVEDTAHVAESAYVGPDAQVFEYARVCEDAQVFENARVYGNARVCRYAQVYGDARVSENARVSGNARVYGHARVSGDAQVYGYARVSENAWVYGYAQVYGNTQLISGTWEKSPLYIQGTKHSVTHCGPDQIAIGCEIHSFSEWLEQYETIGRKNGYTKEEIQEYFIYINTIKDISLLHKKI